MSSKRQYNKKCLLWCNGESQPKVGRCVFKYIDTNGRVQFVYSRKLEKTDKTPTGKRDEISLQEKEKMFQKPERFI